MAAVLPQQASERLPPHLSERLHSSDDEAAWIDRHGEGFRMPASRVGECKGPAYGNRPSTNPRGTGAMLWGFEDSAAAE